MRILRESPFQTAGPFVHLGLAPSMAGVETVYGRDHGSGPLYDEAARGERIEVTGRIFDGAGGLVRDAVVEIWQADADGLYSSPSERRGRADPAFAGWGRTAVLGEQEYFAFKTIKPGPVPTADGRPQAPHIAVFLIARGINTGLHTRLYFPEEAEANALDPLLGRIEHESRRRTLIARREGAAYVFDIVLQGEGETVFLDV